MIKVLASDMDGTLLDENHMLTDRTAEAIKKAQAAGILPIGRIAAPGILGHLQGKPEV